MAEWRKVYRSLFEDEDIGTKVAPLGRLVLVSMIVHADDEGYVELSPAIWRKRTFGYDDDVTARDVKVWVDAIMALRRSRDGSPMIEDLGHGIGRFTRWDDFNRARGDRAKDSALRVKLEEAATKGQPKSPEPHKSGNRPAPKGGRKDAKPTPGASQNDPAGVKTAPEGGETDGHQQSSEGQAEVGQAEATPQGEGSGTSRSGTSEHGEAGQVITTVATNGIPDGNQVSAPNSPLATTGIPAGNPDKSRVEESRKKDQELTGASRSRAQSINDEDIEDVVDRWLTRFPEEKRLDESLLQDLITKSRESNQDPRMIVSMVPQNATSPRGYLIKLVRHTVPFPSLHESLRSIYTWHSFARRNRKHKVSSIGEILGHMT